MISREKSNRKAVERDKLTQQQMRCEPDVQTPVLSQERKQRLRQCNQDKAACSGQVRAKWVRFKGKEEIWSRREAAKLQRAWKTVRSMRGKQNSPAYATQAKHTSCSASATQAHLGRTSRTATSTPCHLLKPVQGAPQSWGLQPRSSAAQPVRKYATERTQKK